MKQFFQNHFFESRGSFEAWNFLWHFLRVENFLKWFFLGVGNFYRGRRIFQKKIQKKSSPIHIIFLRMIAFFQNHFFWVLKISIQESFRGRVLRTGFFYDDRYFFWERDQVESSYIFYQRRWHFLRVERKVVKQFFQNHYFFEGSEFHLRGRREQYPFFQKKFKKNPLSFILFFLSKWEGRGREVYL